MRRFDGWITVAEMQKPEGFDRFYIDLLVTQEYLLVQ